MLRSILVGLDGSLYSTSAVELGIRWAKQADALLVGLGIIDEPTIRGGEPMSIGGEIFKARRDDRLIADARRQVDQILGQFSIRCAEAQVSSKVLEDVGLPDHEIMIEAQRYDLILLGLKTFFHFETQSRPGDTLHKLLKNGPRPVVAVPEKLGAGSGVLIAYDGSLQAARALQVFQPLGLQGANPVHVLSVAPTSVDAARHADRAVEYLQFHDVKAERHAFASTSSPAQVILEQIRKLDAGLVVMGAYGHSTLREFVFGSVTRTMLKECSVPLFLYH